jgi:6-phosphogluconate dehydrogenase (decarboxylating)
MGWGRTLFLGDIGNRLDIADAERDIRSLKHELDAATRGRTSQDELVSALSAENAELKLYLASIVRLLIERGTLSREDIERMVATIDEEDGRIDGGHTGGII